jgi:biotin operon repressor
MSDKNPLEGYWTPQQIADEIKRSTVFVIDCLKGKRKIGLKGIQFGKGKNWFIKDADAREFIRKIQAEDQNWSPAQLAKAVGKSRKYILDAITGYGGTREPSLRAAREGSRWIIERADAEAFILRDGQRRSLEQFAKATGKSRKYILDAITGHEGTREPRLKAVREGNRWIIEDDPEEFIQREKGTSSTDTE